MNNYDDLIIDMNKEEGRRAYNVRQITKTLEKDLRKYFISRFVVPESGFILIDRSKIIVKYYDDDLMLKTNFEATYKEMNEESIRIDIDDVLLKSSLIVAQYVHQQFTIKSIQINGTADRGMFIFVKIDNVQYKFDTVWERLIKP